MNDLNEFPWATFAIVVLAFIIAAVGGAVVVFGDGALSFQDYIDALSKFAIGAGLLGVGRGVRSGLLKSGLRRP